jgi:hypothetical protein
VKTSQKTEVLSIDRLRMFENRVPRRIYGLQRDGMTEGWRKVL